MYTLQSPLFNADKINTPILFLHGTACLFFDHAFDVLIVRLQFGTAEIRIYPLFVISRKFGHDVDFGLADVAHILGSPPVMSLA